MQRTTSCLAAFVLTILAAPSFADEAAGSRDRASGAGELPALYECVDYARQATGIQLYGDAMRWWDQAEGRYARSAAPKPGAVMALRPFGPMQLGHVAAVARVIDSRTILLDHANWSPIDGQRGQVERGVKAVDVSPRNDWSEVRIWYAPTGDLGVTRWPVQGFIYPGASAAPDRAPALRAPQMAKTTKSPPASRIAGRDPIAEILSGL